MTSSYLASLAEPLERRERLCVRRLALEDRAIPLDGRRRPGPSRSRAARRGGASARAAPIVGRRERELRLEVVGELGPHLLAREERVERGERALARGVELEHLSIRGDRVRRDDRASRRRCSPSERRGPRAPSASLSCSMRRSTTPMRSVHRSVRVKSASSAASASASDGSSERTWAYPLAASSISPSRSSIEASRIQYSRASVASVIPSATSP